MGLIALKSEPRGVDAHVDRRSTRSVRMPTAGRRVRFLVVGVVIVLTAFGRCRLHADFYLLYSIPTFGQMNRQGGALNTARGFAWNPISLNTIGTAFTQQPKMENSNSL